MSNDQLQPISDEVVSEDATHGLRTEFDIAFKRFAKRIGLHPSEVGYVPARNPMGYKYYQKNPHLCPPTPKNNKAPLKPTKQGFNYGNKGQA